MERKIPETITEEELIKIVEATKSNKHRASFIIAFYQALRVSEVVNLLPENIDKQQHLIKIKQAKGNKDRNITIVKPLLLDVKQIFKALDLLPIGLGVRALEIAFKNKAKEVLGKNLHFHTLRHSGATWLLNKKHWDLRQIQNFLGHSSIQVTEIYTHVSAQDLVNLEWGNDNTKNTQ